MAKKNRPPYARALKWLTVATAVIGVLAMLSYATGAHIAVRFLNPHAGAWWNEHEFSIMETAAAALGLLIAIRAGARIVDGAAVRRRAVIASVIAGALLLPVLTDISAALARMGWNASSGAIFDRVISLAGYSIGSILDKVVIAGIYFLKTAAFSLLAGFALIAVASAASIAAAVPASRRSEASSR
ncbi:MAG TPA: hypothetical protein VEC38_09475 [Candidatus Binataceae bacterium]|nr:hypothetical protein [Candidatus Binataceae bacterium]